MTIFGGMTTFDRGNDESRSLGGWRPLRGRRLGVGRSFEEGAWYRLIHLLRAEAARLGLDDVLGFR